MLIRNTRKTPSAPFASTRSTPLASPYLWTHRAAEQSRVKATSRTTGNRAPAQVSPASGIAATTGSKRMRPCARRPGRQRLAASARRIGGLPGHVVDLDDGMVDFLAGHRLLFTGRGNGVDLVRRALHRGNNGFRAGEHYGAYSCLSIRTSVIPQTCS